MFNQKSKTDSFTEAPAGSGGASIIASGTTLKGDLSSNGDIRIDGTLKGNINGTAKVIIGANGLVEGDITGQQADIMGRVTGTIKVKELLQLKGGSQINGNIYSNKLQIEPTASFNGQCHMNNAPEIAASTMVHSNGDLKREKVLDKVEEVVE